MNSSASEFVTIATMLFVIGVGVTLLRKAGVEPGSFQVPMWLNVVLLVAALVSVWLAMIYIPPMRTH